MKKIKAYVSYALGAFGHDAFYATLSTYLMMFITSQLFGSGHNSHYMIGYITTMMVAIRIIEIIFDPIIGGIVDNTQTKWGKFKPWLLVGAAVSSIMLMLIFTNFGGLTTKNPTLYLILFGVAYVILDIFYSFKDISLWSMLPALEIDSKDRSKFGTIGRLGSTLGAQGVALVIMPAIALFSGWFGAKSGQKTSAGWFGFAILIAVISFLGALAVCLGTKENDDLIRKQTKHVGVLEVFKVIAKNDQLVWLIVSYFCFALGYVITNNLFLYYFKYVLGKSGSFWLVGAITGVLGVISVLAYPFIAKLISRKGVYVGGIGLMFCGYIVFLFADKSVILALVAISLIFLPYPEIFLAALMTITDSVEYGQLKNGIRNESVSLSVRPLVDKVAGAISNAMVGIISVQAGMVGNASPSSITTMQLLRFKSYMFYGPMVLIVLGAIIYFFQVKLTEKKHAEIVSQLEEKLGKNYAQED